VDTPGLDISRLKALDAETRAYLGTLGLDCSGSEVPAPDKMPSPCTRPQQPLAPQAAPPSSAGEPHPFLSGLLQAAWVIAIGLGILVLGAAVLYPLWLLLVLAWGLLVRVGLPLIACLLVSLIVVYTLEEA
jgi:hypothetical protein